MSDLVSIVMPAYNSEAFIREAIGSCLAQSYTPIELIVIDDGSTDNTVDIVRQYGDKVRLIQQANQGPAIARNTGIRAASGNYIQFCDSDDLLHPEKITRCLPVLKENPSLALVYSKVRQVAADGQSDSGLPDFPPDDYFETSHLFCKILHHGGSPLQTSTILARKSALLDVGLYRADPDQRCAEDWDLLLRLADAYPMAGVPEILTFYRHHDGTLTTDRIAMAEGRLKTAGYIREYATLPDCLDDAAYDKFVAARHHVLAVKYWQAGRRTGARQEMYEAIRLTSEGRVMRYITMFAMYLLSADQFSWVLAQMRGGA